MDLIQSYIPIIRWRLGEVRAIKNLFQKDRNRITPLFEFILPPPKIDKKDYKIILEDSKSKFQRNLPNIAEEMLKCWGTEPVFIDVHLLDGDIRAEAFDRILSSSGDLNILSIPTIYVVSGSESKADVETRKIAVKYAKMNKRGMCIRIDDSHLDNDLPKRIDEFIKNNKLDIHKIDLLVDLKVVDREVKKETVVKKISYIPHIKKWRTFILGGGSFPKDLSNFEKHGNYSIERYDWNLWKNVIRNNIFERSIYFSDYTVQHPIYYGYMLNVNTSASIRYTNEESWEIWRGEGLKNEKGAGYMQYPAHAKLLIGQPFYKGSKYSYGDLYIWERAQPENKNTGNPQTWITAGINHHITLVADQVSSFL